MPHLDAMKIAKDKNKIDQDYWKWGDYVEHSFTDLQNTNFNNCCQYPIKYLRDSLVCILPGQLIIIAADTGQGKSFLASWTALYNSQLGKRVHLFALEGDVFEVINRERFKRIYEKARKLDLDFLNQLDYTRYISGVFTEELMFWDEEDENKLKKDYKNLNVYRNNEPLNADNIVEHIERIKDESDLVIIDHLHYFDFGSSNEHAELTEIMKRVKNLTRKYRIPVVLISHLRKKDKDRAFPDIDDVHGTSNIGKQADVALIFSNVSLPENTLEDQIEKHKFMTGIKIAKCRNGIPPYFVGVLEFDKLDFKYSDNYLLHFATRSNIKALEVDKYPRWADKTGLQKKQIEYNTLKQEENKNEKEEWWTAY
jgi:replicative DNA helicase